ncbi:MAG: cytochrome c3 family protein [Planctomycetota bacterium]|jgi:predicted CXXCH cytochrome family protein
MRLYGDNQFLPVLFLCCAAILVTGQDARAQDRVHQTVHNLSASGPGKIRAPSESRVCVFCHAPHNTLGMVPLWNREMPMSSYTIYKSSTLDANPGQPTGASKLCLSCHDGTIALGNIVSQTDRIRMVGGDFMPAGLTNLGTDLSDDHPISFTYTTGLTASDRQLAHPFGLPPEIKLDASNQLQCTSCHDAHNNTHGNFLVISNNYGALCIACHRMDGWQTSSHRTSSTSTLGWQTGDWPLSTVAENACRCCHRSHTAGGRERLLIFEKEEENCLICHNGQIAATDILSELNKRSAHDPRRYTGLHDPRETLSGDKSHVECADCHNPHAVAPSQPVGTGYEPLGATLAKMSGISASGVSIQEAVNEYEICFRCHGDSAVDVKRGIGRQAQTRNLRLKFNPTNPSFHPLVTSVSNTDTVSLVPEMSRGAMIRCTDCHNNDAGPRANGQGPNGPHGSVHDYLLERNYTIEDDTLESEFAYAICYKCHRRTSILNDESFRWHRKHIEEEKTPCSVCHDPHGISRITMFNSDHTHLINFDTVIVRPEASTGRLQFRDLGRYTGSCTLICHGRVHIDEEYR